jgi:hypothetical protein
MRAFLPVRSVPCAAALLAALAAGTLSAQAAQAQSASTFSCTTGTVSATADLSSDRRPVPRILRYAVGQGTDPAPAGALREAREASVTGGDATQGWLRIDVQFDSVIPRGCRLPLLLTMATDSGRPDDRIVFEQLARVLDGMEVVAGQVSFMDHLAGALRFAGSGTDTASFRIPIRAGTTQRSTAHALKLVLAQDFAGGLPVTVNVAPLPAFTVVAPAAPLNAGAGVSLRAEHPAQLLPGTAAMPVTFRIAPGTLGRWSNAPAATPSETRSTWDTRFTPLRSEAVLVPAALAQTTTGSVTISFAGQTRTVPVTVGGAPAAAAGCDPVFTVVAAPGGLRLTMANRGAGSCPAHLAKPRPLAASAFQFTPAQVRLTAATAPAIKTAPVGAVLRPGITPPLLGNGGGTQFTLGPKALALLKPGVRFDFDIVAEGPNAVAGKLRTGLTLTAADIAVMKGK